VIHIQSPSPVNYNHNLQSVFLAGSIDLGCAVDWQSLILQRLDDLNIVVINPRRDNWDIKIRQNIDDTVFREQVEWELNAQEKADIIAFYFAPNTLAPITLLEFGLAINKKRMIVCCPSGFWRKGNIDIVCAHYGIPQVNTLDDLISAIRLEVITSYSAIPERRAL